MSAERLAVIAQRAIAADTASEWPDREPVTISMADVVAQRVEWLWDGWLPQARLSLCIGHAGQGK